MESFVILLCTHYGNKPIIFLLYKCKKKHLSRLPDFNVEFFCTYLDKADSVSFKINTKSQPKITTSIFSSLNEEKPKASSSENVQKEVSVSSTLYTCSLKVL